MTAEVDPAADAGARPLNGSMLENSGLPVERMPGLAAALEGFIAEAPKSLAPLIGSPAKPGAVEAARSTSLFQAIGDCRGLVAAIYVSAEPKARILVALDERIDALIIASIFGESVAPAGESAPDDPSPRARTPIETALVEEFARGLGRAIEAGFAPIAPLSLAFERLVALNDVYALGRRDMPAAATRFSLPIGGGTVEGLALLPQSLLLPFRRELEREREAEAPAPDRRWSHSMEAGLRQTRLPMIAILDELSMTLGDIAGFRLGALLPLQCADVDSVRLVCADRGMFSCKLGQRDGRYRLEIETTLAPPGEPAPISRL